MAAQFIGGRAERFDAAIVHQDWIGDRASAASFERTAQAPVLRVDFGWRPNSTGDRPLVGKIWSHLVRRAVLMRLPGRVRRFAPDIIYSSAQRWDCAVASHLSRRLDRPHLMHLHYPVGPWLGQEVIRRLPACAHVLAVSDFIRGELLRAGVSPDRTSVIRYPFQVPVPKAEAIRASTRARVLDELGIKSTDRVIGMVARLDRSKGQIETIRAFEQLAADRAQVHLVIVGEQLQAGTGLAVNDLRQIAASTAVGGRIHLTGGRSDVLDLLTAFDVFAHPSKQDASPVAVIEASASGLPVVGWDDGGVPEIVAGGESGLLAPVDDVRRLSDCLARLVDDRTLATTMGAAGRTRIARQYDPRTSARQFVELVNRVAASRCVPTSGH
jgi:glycosyltransferase involved in cell wall biosynthesis